MSLTAHVSLQRGELALDAALDELTGVTAVVGPNGAGKTTLLRAVAGLTPGARVQLNGESLDDLPPHLRRIGLLLAEPLLPPDATVQQAVAVAAGGRRRQRLAAAHGLLEELGCADLAARRCRSLSSGEAARVGLARALVGRPRALLLDEPLARLDAEARPAVRVALRQALTSYSPPVVLVTHDVVDVAALAQRVIVLEAGRVVQDCPPAELTARPRSAWAARFAGLELLRGRATGDAVALDGGGQLEVAGDHTGPVLVAVRASSLTVSTERPHGSARNTWPAVVRSLEPLGDRVRVLLAGPPDVAADLTVGAITELGLAPGREVWASVKATDLEAYPA